MAGIAQCDCGEDASLSLSIIVYQVGKGRHRAKDVSETLARFCRSCARKTVNRLALTNSIRILVGRALAGDPRRDRGSNGE